MTLKTVAPFTGAWIEIRQDRLLHHSKLVAPFTGAWIEITVERMFICPAWCRSLHGSVD